MTEALLKVTGQGLVSDPIGTVQGLFVPCLAIAWDPFSEVVADKMSPLPSSKCPPSPPLTQPLCHAGDGFWHLCML